jgi:hypothetical protein
MQGFNKSMTVQICSTVMSGDECSIISGLPIAKLV